MLQNYEDWQAETLTIILDIRGIQAKQHHTNEELRSLTLEALSAAHPSTTLARHYMNGSAEEAAKKWQRWSVHHALQWQINQEVCGYRAAVNKLQSWSLRLAHNSPDPEPGRETSYQHNFWLTAGPSWRVFNHQEVTRSSATSDRSLRTKQFWPSWRSLLTVVLEAMKMQTDCQKWEANWSNLHTPCPTVKQRPYLKQL